MSSHSSGQGRSAAIASSTGVSGSSQRSTPAGVRIAGMRSWIAAQTPLASVVTMAAVSSSEPSGPCQVSQIPARGIGARSLRRIRCGTLRRPSRSHS
jgi:hypothetical protein